jgi:ADP-ribose diphosphatase
MNASPPVIVRSKRRVFDGFFKLDEVTVSHRQFDGRMSSDKKLLIFERGDAVAALILNRDSGQVILVEQFRAPILGKGSSDGTMIEAVAGMIRGAETPSAAIIREVYEETGYRISDPEHVATFFSSPGGTSERIFLYYAVVEDADQTGPEGGNRADGEDIRLVKMTPEELFERLRRAAVDDPKLIIAAYHLKDRIATDRHRPKVLSPSTVEFALKSNPELVIGIKTGEILKVKGVDVWVNSENTDMMMDRIFDKSISANIRYGGAEKDTNRAVRVDTIADALRRKLHGHRYVRLTSVLETESGALIKQGVNRIVHVAAVDGILPGKGVHADPEIIAICLGKALQHVHQRNGRWSLFKGREPPFPLKPLARSLNLFSPPDRSILVPLFGTGDGGLSPGQVASRLVEAALEFFDNHPETELRKIYLLAYKAPDLDACMKALLERTELSRK